MNISKQISSNLEISANLNKDPDASLPCLVDGSSTSTLRKLNLGLGI